MDRSTFHGCELVDWSVAARPIKGEAISGDLHLVKPIDHGVVLAAIDGVGHGDEATAAAVRAVRVIEEHCDESIIALIRHCHQALTRTRGVVMTVARFHAPENTLTWMGVGNVEGHLFRTESGATHLAESVLLRAGVVGYQLPALQASVIPVLPGDILILATDGIRTEFANNVRLNDPPSHLAASILDRYFKGTDDALVLVARYAGMPHE